MSLNGAIRGRPYAAWMHVFAIVDDKKAVYVKVFLNGPISSLAKSLTSVGGSLRVAHTCRCIQRNALARVTNSPDSFMSNKGVVCHTHVSTGGTRQRRMVQTKLAVIFILGESLFIT